MEKIEELFLNYGYIKDNKNLKEKREIVSNTSLKLLKKIKEFSNENKEIKNIRINEEIKYVNKIREDLTDASLKRLKEKDKEKLKNIIKELTSGKIKVGYSLKNLKDIEKQLSSLINKQLKAENRIIDKIKNELTEDEYDEIKYYIECDEFREILSKN